MAATAAKWAHFGTTLLFRSHKGRASSPSLLFSSVKLKPKSQPQPLRFLSSRLHCSSPAVDTVTISGAEFDSETASKPRHPWPEWVAFVDRLSAGGYFGAAARAEEEGSDGFYVDMNLLKDACLSFARDRYDVFTSLSTKDIEVIVGGGCPNLLRKVVNSAKRLRAYVKIDEGDVCGACNLRGSCDRAYTILKASESDARTVDLVRVLLFYALDSSVISGGEKPAGRELVESSARKLLSELLKLGETARDPALALPAAKVPKKKENPSTFFEDGASENVEMKRGDWMCSNCNYMNFSRNLRCLKCKEHGPKSVGGTKIEMTKGDWTCPECSFMNFSRNTRCLKCKAEGPQKVSEDKIEMKKGDWNCPQCQFMNFASNRKCLRCQEARPKRQLNPGEWECPSCDFLNYRRNMVCLKCNCKRPNEPEISEYEQQIWRKPR